MKLVLILVALACVCSAFPTYAEDTAEKSTVNVQGEKAAASYCIGVQVGKSLEDVKDFVDLAIFTAAIEDIFAEKELAISDEEMGVHLKAVQEKIMAARETRTNKEAEENTAKGKAYLEENAKKEGVKVTESGLQYKVLTAGDGAKPTADDTVKVHYKGTFIDGKTFDSSYDRGEPAEFKASGLIKGWVEALQMMPVGSKWELVIPSELAYGAGGRGIPPNSVLVFEMELLDIVK